MPRRWFVRYIVSLAISTGVDPKTLVRHLYGDETTKYLMELDRALSDRIQDELVKGIEDLKKEG